MTEAILKLVATHGPVLVFLAALLSAIGLPVPGTLSLLAAGSFVASGEMHLGAVAAAALAGTVLGDQVGYGIGARGGAPAIDWATRRGMGPEVARARDLSARWGDWGNFLCRWLISPIAPAVNLVSGAIGTRWGRFTLVCVLGEVVWVALYIGLGFAFSRSILAIARASGDLGMFILAGGASIALGLRLRKHIRATA